MESEARKARVKSLKRILNNLSIEIRELKARGYCDTEDLDQARQSIARFCEKLSPSPDGAACQMHDYQAVHTPRLQPVHPPLRSTRA